MTPPKTSTLAATSTAARLRSKFLHAWYLAILALLLPFVLEPNAVAEVQSAGSTFFLRDGDRIVFFGDSITEQAHYTFAIELYVRLRFPKLNVSFVNSGWSGDRAWGGEGGMLDERLERDVIAHRPTVVTVMLGMNDGYYMNYDAKVVEAFTSSLEHAVEKIGKALPGVRIVLLGTSPYDNVTPGAPPDWEKGIAGGYNAVVRRFSAATREVAAKHHLLFVDMNEPLVQLLTRLQEKKPELARQLIPDRIHPGPVAGWVMAACLLNTWSASATERDTNIEGREAVKGVLHVELELPLPLPLDANDPLTKLVRESSPELKALTDETLSVTDLPFSRASVEIDGNAVGEFTAAQLMSGLDLASLDPRLSDRSASLSKLIQLRDRARFICWRNLQLPFAAKPQPEAQQAATELAAMEQELGALVESFAKPDRHAIKIISAER
jgi:lysophospholipase L1-like esterase